MTIATHVPEPSISRLVAVLAMLGSAACWGGGTVATKGALGYFGPFVLLSIQLLASVVALWLVIVLANKPLRLPTQAVRVAATGVFEPGLAYAVSVPGLVLTTASNASVIASLEPVIILILGWVLLRLSPQPMAVLTISVAVIGVCLISYPAQSALNQGDARGDALILLGTVFAALYVVTSSRFVATTGALVMTALQQSAGLLLVLTITLVALTTGYEHIPGMPSGDMLLLAICSGLIQYALAFWLYLIGLKTLPVGVAGLFLTLTPIFGIAGGMVFLGENMSLLQLLGAVIILGALMALLRTQKV